MMKRIKLHFFTVLTMTLLALTAIAHDFEVDGIYYNINGNEATVTYYGTSYSSSEYSGSVNIPATVTYAGMTYSVTTISDDAFSECIGLTSITIPNSVTTIGDWAFYYCSGLTSVTIPNSVTYIGNSAFFGCSGITSITIPNSITIIRTDTFSDCSGLTSVTIPNSVTHINEAAFYGCSGLTSVTIPNSVTTIGNYAFSDCSGLISITIPNSVTTIGTRVFSRCSGLTSITVESGNPKYDSRNNCNAIIETASNKLIAGCMNTVISNSVTTIGDWAFNGCYGLTSVTIPNSVTTIGYEAFSDCSGLTSVTIPNSVTTIGNYAFSDCSGLTSVTCLAVTPPTTSSNTFSGATSQATLYVPRGSVAAYQAADNWKDFSQIVEFDFEVDGMYYSALTDGTAIVIPRPDEEYYQGEVVIPETVTYQDVIFSVTAIDDGAFQSCTGLTSITIPNSVTTIGYEAFWMCSGLTRITVESGNPNYDSRNNCNAIIETATNKLIAGCMNTVIPNTITTIGFSAFFGCSGLTSITIPNSVTYINEAAFWMCDRLKFVTCLAFTPPAMYFFHDDEPAFPSWVTSQATLYVPRATIATYQTTDVWKDFSQIVEFDFVVDGMYYCALTDNTAMVIPKPDEDYYQGDVMIPETVTYQDVTFNVTAIDAGAFEDCYELNSVVIGDAVESIGENAFQGCTGLTSVTIGSGVTTIGANAFNYCNALQTVTCRGTVPPVMASSNCFSTAAYNRAKLVVPRPEIETYAATDYWYKFAHIEGWGYLGPGDVNGSGTIDMDDLTRLINIMLTDDLDGIDPSWADVTGNGIVSMNDLTELINLLLTQ